MDKSLIEYENALLGAYASDPDLFEHIQHLVSPNLFSSTNTQRGYNVIKIYTSSITPT